MIQLKNPFILAPMAGITDSPFRSICKKMGASLVYSEMVSAKGLYYDGNRTEALLSYDEDEEPVAFQIFGSEEEMIAFAVKKMNKYGHKIVDINMGCPVPKVVKNGDGAALMKDPVLAAKLVKRAVTEEKGLAADSDREPRDVTVKIRAGWDEKPYDLTGFVKRLEDAGASAVAIHARTRCQMYKGKADWEKIAEVKEALEIPVIGSGDVFTGQDAIKMLEQTKADYCMIARGALGNPWIFKEALSLWEKTPISIEAIKKAELKDVMLKHLLMQVGFSGEKRAIFEIRKHMGWYLKGFSRAARLREKVNKATSVDEIKGIIEEL